MRRSIQCLLGRQFPSYALRNASLSTQQTAAGHWSLRDLRANGGMAGACQTRYLCQTMWLRETSGSLSATAECAPTLPGQSAIQKNKVVQEDVDPINLVSLKVGRIDGVARHPDADMLYVLSMDLGEYSSTGTSGESSETSQRRTIVSGLVPYYSPEQLLGRHAVVFANLKPRKLRGIMSHGMLLAASSSEHAGSLVVEILEAPAASRPGDRIIVSPAVEADSCSDRSLERPFDKPVVKKQKQVDLFLQGLSLNSRLASYNGRKLVTDSGGEVSARTLLTGVVG
ncbi:hypothetical protein GGI09_003812 [Coemansia sp. S100]|nr:hypothetical protein GGI09_003812 [Coemansia sp. S100]KAJ2107608.1 hypothetical protein GGI16_001459 [Coemansia sp. S142-1]